MFQDSLKHILLFLIIILTNMSISNNSKSLDKCILRVLQLCSIAQT